MISRASPLLRGLPFSPRGTVHQLKGGVSSPVSGFSSTLPAATAFSKGISGWTKGSGPRSKTRFTASTRPLSERQFLVSEKSSSAWRLACR